MNEISEQVDTAEQPPAATDKAEAVTLIDGVVAELKDNPQRALDKDVIAALVTLNRDDRASFVRKRQQLKAANRQVSLQALDELIGLKADDDKADAGASNAEMVVALITGQDAELFHSPDGDCYASMADSETGIRQTWPIASSGFTDWMAAMAWRTLGLAATDSLLKTCIATLSGIAKFDGEQKPVALRCADNPNGDGVIIDLSNDGWQAVEVTSTGWRVLDQSPTRFWRPKPAQPLPVPERGGDLSELWQYANVADDECYLVLAWMLESWRPNTDFPILELIGEQGSAKSSTQTVLRAIVDPTEVPLRAAPKAVDDIFIAARNAWMVSFNNLSHLSKPQQDALCSLATPGGFASRTLYTNGEETAWNTQRPVAINGISSLATAPDLIDRIIYIEPPRIETYQQSSNLRAVFAGARPRILGALFDLFSATLAQLDDVRIDNPPRLADYGYLGEAMMRALGHEAGSFMRIYRDNRRQAALRSIASSPVAQAVMALVDERVNWTGTYKALLDALDGYRHEGDGWPKSPRGLADALRRNKPPLRVAGYDAHEDPTRHNDGYHVVLSRLKKQPRKDVHEVHDVHGHPREHWPA